MHVYFVRHCSTDFNKRHRHQSPNTPLSREGREAAVGVGESLRAMNPDLLVSSEYTRAIETARIIGLHVGLSPVTNGLFYEIMRPSELYEELTISPRTLLYMTLSVLYRKNPRWRYKDAENFTDIRERARKALAYLESLKGEHQSVIVVSHTVFINIMVAYMKSEEMPSLWNLFLTYVHIERMKNGAVIHLESDDEKGSKTTWSIVRK